MGETEEERSRVIKRESRQKKETRGGNNNMVGWRERQTERKYF